jgi:histidinol dehydrogenase
MNILRFNEGDFVQRLEALGQNSSLFDPIIEERTKAILEAVRTRGDDALLELTQRFDGATLRLDQLPSRLPSIWILRCALTRVCAKRWRQPPQH